VYNFSLPIKVAFSTLIIWSGIHCCRRHHCHCRFVDSVCHCCNYRLLPT